MSKIQINELNTASIEALNAQETAEVVGGFFGGFSSSFFSDNDFAAVSQGNFNSTGQVSLGGPFGSTGNSNSNGQSNFASISQ